MNWFIAFLAFVDLGLEVMRFFLSSLQKKLCDVSVILVGWAITGHKCHFWTVHIWCEMQPAAELQRAGKFAEAGERELHTAQVTFFIVMVPFVLRGAFYSAALYCCDFLRPPCGQALWVQFFLQLFSIFRARVFLKVVNSEPFPGARYIIGSGNRGPQAEMDAVNKHCCLKRFFHTNKRFPNSGPYKNHDDDGCFTQIHADSMHFLETKQSNNGKRKTSPQTEGLGYANTCPMIQLI